MGLPAFDLRVLGGAGPEAGLRGFRFAGRVDEGAKGSKGRSESCPCGRHRKRREAAGAAGSP